MRDDEIYNLLTYYNIYIILFYIICVPSNIGGLVLPLVIRYGDIVKEISLVEF